MKVTDIPCVISGLHVMEAKFRNDPSSGLTLHADYALTSGGLGDIGVPVATHGKCTAYPTNWSKETLALLKDLIESMETDLLPRHFPETKKENSNATTWIESGRDEEAGQV